MSDVIFPNLNKVEIKQNWILFFSTVRLQDRFTVIKRNFQISYLIVGKAKDKLSLWVRLFGLLVQDISSPEIREVSLLNDNLSKLKDDLYQETN